MSVTAARWSDARISKKWRVAKFRRPRTACSKSLRIPTRASSWARTPPAKRPYHTFIDAIFNFPTFAEAYRIAALDIYGKRAQRIAAE